jgi:hypothetical protein
LSGDEFLKIRLTKILKIDPVDGHR